MIVVRSFRRTLCTVAMLLVPLLLAACGGGSADGARLSGGTTQAVGGLNCSTSAQICQTRFMPAPACSPQICAGAQGFGQTCMTNYCPSPQTYLDCNPAPTVCTGSSVTVGGGSTTTPPVTPPPKLTSVDVFDVREVALSVAAGSGALLDSHGVAVSEAVVQQLDSKRMQGLVADGNARLLVRVRADSQVQVQATLSGGTSAGLTSLGGGRPAPTLTLTTTAGGNGGTGYQATFVLLAGEDFSGAAGQADSRFSVSICAKSSSGACADSRSVALAERRVPIVLLHGLWSTSNAFDNTPDGNPGLRPALAAAGYSVAVYSFDNDAGGYDGPTVTMPANNVILASAIMGLCRREDDAGAACTRATLVGHSLGGLVARKYIADNQNHRSAHNLQQGSVAKLITLGTPHDGSPLASLLLGDLPCEKGPDGAPFLDRLQFYLGLPKFHHRIGTAIPDLEPGSPFLQWLNRQPDTVPMFAVAGNLGPNRVVARTSDGWLDLESTVLQAALACSAHDVFSGANTDGVVATDSALGHYSAAQIIANVEHIGMGANAAVNKAVLARLAMPTRGSWDGR
jgi:pimeloyl-ACP methyl ester carboxylesterase